MSEGEREEVREREREVASSPGSPPEWSLETRVRENGE